MQHIMHAAYNELCIIIFLLSAVYTGSDSGPTVYGIETGHLHGSQCPSNRAAGVNPPTPTQVRAKSTLDRLNTELLALFSGRFVGGGKNVNRPGNEATEITCTCLQPLIYMYMFATSDLYVHVHDNM